MSKMVVWVTRIPTYTPGQMVRSTSMKTCGLHIRFGTDVVELRIPDDIETMTWLGEVLQEAADRVHKEAEEIFRELRRYPRAEDEKGHQEVPQ